jgi:cycloartenol synthase
MQEDAYYPHTWLQECLSDCLYSFGEPFLARWPVSYMRRKALQQIADFLKYEDENSQYICIGAAQKVRLMSSHVLNLQSPSIVLEILLP